MAADFSRVRSNPLLDYAGVELKQGAVLLDADANELVAILDRRLRALAGDVLGRATVGANTPDAFRIELDADGRLLIGRGRLYVDGLLAENHGDANPKLRREFDDLMAETRYEAPVPYNPQPYLRSLPKLPQRGRHLVYLDVWNREITHLENPALIETAVGVETSSRLQTAWQVRLMEVGSDATCSSPDGKWSEFIAPSTGRLTTGTYEASEVSDPCELPPSGGFRGLENQLYRVEIHDPGQPSTPAQPGTATFTWSRENASVCSRVASIVSDTTLELESLGRDDVLRFNTGDWVEVIDDASEQLGVAESRAAGVLRKITVEEATRRISFSIALPTEMVSTVSGNGSNLRVRRWDQKGRVLSTSGGGATAVFADLDASDSGAIPVPAAGTTLLLEDGVTVSFSLAEGSKGFRAGDYWVFAARTADASVEHLTEAPPRGIHHHYARLAIWDVGANPALTDCRNLWPPQGGKDRSEDCGCTVCVTPELNKQLLPIQKAVELVMKAGGGTVCLQAGLYELATPVQLGGARSLRIKGQGPATVIVAKKGTAWNIETGSAITIEDLAIISESGDSAAVAIRTAVDVTLQRLSILLRGKPDAPGAGVALTGVIPGLVVRDNLIFAPQGIRPLSDSEGGLKLLITAALRISDNIFICHREGISLSSVVGHALASKITDNELLGCRAGGISVLGFTLSGGSMRIANNSLKVLGPGIRCAVDGTWIEGNKVTAARGKEQAGCGIVLAASPDQNDSKQCQILANQVSGFPEAGILITARSRDLMIKLNVIENCRNGIEMLDGASANALSIENNHLRDIGPENPDGPALKFVVGIKVLRSEVATVAGNKLRGIGLHASDGTGYIAGIAHFAVSRTRISGNEITQIGSLTGPKGATVAGVMLLAPYAQNEIHDNHIECDGTADTPAEITPWSALSAQELEAKQPRIRLGTFSALRLNEDRALVIDGAHAHLDLTVERGIAGASVPRGSSAAVRGNVLLGRGSAAAVSVAAGRDVRFADNRCELRGDAASVVSLRSSAGIVSSNLIRGGKRSLELTAKIEQSTILGNATSGDISVDNHPLSGTVWEKLNVRI